MNKEKYKKIIVAFLVGITILSVTFYIISWKEKNDLVLALKQAREEADILENERQNLLQELEKEKELELALNEQNDGLKQGLMDAEVKLAKVSADFAQVQSVLAQLNAEMAALKEENVLLRDEKGQLNTRVAVLTDENSVMKVKLSTVAELKKAIRELKRQTRRAGAVIKNNVAIIRNIVGNRGYVVKDGKSTFLSPPKVKIDVIPALSADSPPAAANEELP